MKPTSSLKQVTFPAIVSSILAGLWLAACSPCPPGKAIECLCDDGTLGMQVCGEDGKYGSCGCTGASLPGLDGAAPAADGASPTPGGDGGPLGDAATANRPPVIEAFQVDRTTITPGDHIELIATLSDPDGLEDVVGGDLIDPETDKIIDDFRRRAAGRFEGNLYWSDVNRLRELSFTGTQQRRVIARFRDRGGLHVEREVTVTFDCQGKTACAGECTDLATDSQHCGACGKRCDLGRCVAGKCHTWGECIRATSNGGTHKTCNIFCQTQGRGCSDQCSTSTGAQKLYYSKSDCDRTPIGPSYVQQTCSDGLSFNGDQIPWFRCCCRDL